MCLAVPARIVELQGTTATVSVIEGPRLGDYVLVHAGFAIHRWERSDVEELEAIRAAAGLREATT